jgi:hypothetical protein
MMGGNLKKRSMPIHELPENDELFGENGFLRQSPDIYQEINVLQYPEHEGTPRWTSKVDDGSTGLNLTGKLVGPSPLRELNPPFRRKERKSNTLVAKPKSKPNHITMVTPRWHKGQTQDQKNPSLDPFAAQILGFNTMPKQRLTSNGPGIRINRAYNRNHRAGSRSKSRNASHQKKTFLGPM